jgi:4-hydroxysphinganine ceramide fatty acyl 2-hydroxylase
MPPVLFFTLSFPMTRLAHLLFPAAMANGTISGSFVFCKSLSLYVPCPSLLACRCYLRYNALRVRCPSASTLGISDRLNSSMHHTKLPAYLREQKKYHLAHHYKNFELGFGVTSKTFSPPT